MDSILREFYLRGFPSTTCSSTIHRLTPFFPTRSKKVHLYIISFPAFQNTFIRQLEISRYIPLNLYSQYYITPLCESIPCSLLEVGNHHPLRKRNLGTGNKLLIDKRELRCRLLVRFQRNWIFSSRNCLLTCYLPQD